MTGLISEVFIDPKAYNKFKYYESLAKGEVSAMGKVHMIDGKAYVHDIVLLKQECSAADTEIDDHAIGKALYELREVEGSLSCWIHSHQGMQVFWSGTDEAMIKQFSTNGSFIIAIVTNNEGEYQCAYSHGGNEQVPAMFVDDISLTFGKPFSKEDKEVMDKDFKKLVKEKTIPVGPHPFDRKGRVNSNLIGDVDTPPVLLNWVDGCGIPKRHWDDTFDSYMYYYGDEPTCAKELFKHYNETCKDYMLEDDKLQGGKNVRSSISNKTK